MSSNQINMYRHMISLSDKRYDEIYEGIQKSYKNSCVLWIEEIKNDHLETEYQAQKESILQLRGKVEEHTLYHGTGEHIVDIIINKGFDPSANRVSILGKGTYFAKNASYSKNYAPPSMGDEISFMLICDVLVGKTHVYGRDTTINTTLHDNSVDHLNSPSIYVTPYKYGAIPRYVVAFYKVT